MSKLHKYLSHVQGHLDEGEKVEQAVLGAYETKMMGNDTVRNGILAATNQRLLFYSKRTFGYEMEVFPYSNISSIEMGKKAMGYYISFYSSGNKVSMKWINDKEIGQFVNLVKSRIGKSISTPAAVAAPDELDQLKKLAELKQMGAITQEEFDAKKKQILGL